jgi:2-polyprenyl-6-hydroxyphenyl methylase/3-demethylubiquinone-9 3-methyltransferase
MDWLASGLTDQSSQSMNKTQAEETRRGERFQFGKNWKRLLATLDEERIAEAERSLRQMLGVASLAGYTLLDIGSGIHSTKRR